MKKYKVVTGIAGALLLLSLLLCITKNYWHNQAISIIGGSDGPTSIFIAGKPGTPYSLYFITVILVLIIAILLYLGRDKK